MVKAETLTAEGAATQLHVIDDYCVWLDTEIDTCDGLCIGIGATRREALEDAATELRDRLADIERALEVAA